MLWDPAGPGPKLHEGLGFRVWGLGFGVSGFWFGVWGLGFGVWGLGFGVLGFWGFGVWATYKCETKYTLNLVVTRVTLLKSAHEPRK